MIKIYHNPRCRKSRAGLEHLKSKTSDFEVVEYLKDPISAQVLTRLLSKLNQPAAKLVRTQEEVYKKQFKGKEFTDDEWVKIMLEYPKLIKRPIVEKDYKAVWADPPEEIDKLF